MTVKDPIEKLIETPEYHQLQVLQRAFNIFEFLEDRLTEPIWSRILGGILDSTKPHNLGSNPLLLWLNVIRNERIGKIGNFIKMLSAERHATVRTINEYYLPNGGRLDILIQILNPNHRLMGIIGVENKLDSPEGEAQICDYQHDLVKKFSPTPQMIIFLSPTGEEAKTAEVNNKCPCIPCSYKAIVQMCKSLMRESQPSVKILFDNLIEYINYDIIKGENKMTTESKKIDIKTLGRS